LRRNIDVLNENVLEKIVKIYGSQLIQRNIIITDIGSVRLYGEESFLLNKSKIKYKCDDAFCFLLMKVY
jgi:hypothetical protein